jgi:hypothetical protein
LKVEEVFCVCWLKWACRICERLLI